MQQNNSTNHLKTRAIIIRCSDRSFMEILSFIKAEPETFTVFTRTSNLKLVVSEEAF